MRQIKYHTITHLRIYIDMSKPAQSSRHHAENIFKCISLNEKFRFLIPMSLSDNRTNENNFGIITPQWAQAVLIIQR